MIEVRQAENDLLDNVLLVRVQAIMRPLLSEAIMQSASDNDRRLKSLDRPTTLGDWWKEFCK